MIESTYEKIDKFLASLNYPVHEATYKIALCTMEQEEAIRISRRALWLAKLRRATNEKFGRCFGSEE